MKCSKCDEDKSSDQFHSRMRNGKRYVYKHCIECHRRMVRSHYEENRQAYIDKAGLRRPVAKAAARDYVCAYLLEHPCTDCGEPDLVVLQFDHCRGEVKKANVTDMVRDGLKIETIQAEIDKCDVVCANCHARRTAKRSGWWSLALIAQRIEQPATDRQVGSSSLSESTMDV